MNTCEIAAKSFSGSNGSFSYRLGLMTSDGLPPISSVYPSAAALATRSVATLLPAPGTFSTTNGVPQTSENRSDRIRAARSGAVPAVKPTRILTGRLGEDCASAEDDTASARHSVRQRRRNILHRRPGERRDP